MNGSNRFLWVSKKDREGTTGAKAALRRNHTKSMITWSKAKLSPTFAWICSPEGRAEMEQKEESQGRQKGKVHAISQGRQTAGRQCSLAACKREKPQATQQGMGTNHFDCAVLGTTEHILHFHSFHHTHFLTRHHNFPLCHDPNTREVSQYAHK